MSHGPSAFLYDNLTSSLGALVKSVKIAIERPTEKTLEKLHKNAMDGNWEDVFAFLNTKGAPALYSSFKDTTLLGIAAQYVRADVAEKLIVIYQMPVDQRDGNQHTPLFKALSSKDNFTEMNETVKILIKHGASPDIDCRAKTPLTLATDHFANSMNILRELQFAQFNQQRNRLAQAKNEGPFIDKIEIVHLAMLGELQKINALLEANANPNVIDPRLHHSTALISAARFNLFDIVKLLLEKDALVDIRDQDHLNPLDIAQKNMELFRDLLNVLRTSRTHKHFSSTSTTPTGSFSLPGSARSSFGSRAPSPYESKEDDDFQEINDETVKPGKSSSFLHK